MSFYATKMMNAVQAAQIHGDTDLAKEEVLFETFNQAVRNKAVESVTQVDATLEWIEDRGGLRGMAELGFRVWKRDDEDDADDIFIVSWAHKVKATIT